MDKTESKSHGVPLISLDTSQVVHNKAADKNGFPSKMVTVGLIDRYQSERVFTLNVDDPLKAAILDNSDFNMDPDHPSFVGWHTCLDEGGSLVFHVREFVPLGRQPLALKAVEKRLYDIYFSKFGIAGWAMPPDGKERRVKPSFLNSLSRMPRPPEGTRGGTTRMRPYDSENHKTKLKLPDFVTCEKTVASNSDKKDPGKDTHAEETEPHSLIKNRNVSESVVSGLVEQPVPPYISQLIKYVDDLFEGEEET